MTYSINEERYFYLTSGSMGGAASLADNGGNVCYFAFIPLTTGTVYTITITTADTRLRCATFAEEPTSASSAGIRHVVNSYESPSAGNSFSFTANTGENVLAIYGGAADSGATGCGAVTVESYVITHAYDTMQELINAEKRNMTCLINNVSYDDNTYTITSIPSWLKFNSLSATSIYASGNSWLGINSATEFIRFNRRDCKMFYLWTEEGTLFNYYNFFKVRWRGYSQYNSAYWQEWECIFFDSGDLMIRAVEIPSSYWNGTFNVVASQTYTYTAPTLSSPYISFYTLDENNSTFRVAYELLNIHYPSRWLIEDGGVFYNLEDGELNPLSITEVTADNMEQYGFIGAPDGELLTGLTTPTLYSWNDETAPTPTINVTLSAKPFSQTMTCVEDMSDSSIGGIDSVTAEFSGDVTVKYSLDDGATYTEDMSITDFLALDFDALYEGLPADKKLYLIFTFNEGGILTNLIFNFL